MEVREHIYLLQVFSLFSRYHAAFSGMKFSSFSFSFLFFIPERQTSELPSCIFCRQLPLFITRHYFHYDINGHCHVSAAAIFFFSSISFSFHYYFVAEALSFSAIFRNIHIFFIIFIFSHCTERCLLLSRFLSHLRQREVW